MIEMKTGAFHSARDVDFWFREVRQAKSTQGSNYLYPEQHPWGDGGNLLVHSGWLTKQGHRIKTFKRRFFTLSIEGAANKTIAVLRYFTSEECKKMKGHVVLGTVSDSGSPRGSSVTPVVLEDTKVPTLDRNQPQYGMKLILLRGNYKLILVADDLQTKRTWQQQLRLASGHALQMLLYCLLLF
jgi:hypothetical protein